MNYKSCGKKYNGEKAIISLTSWKARINTVSKTIYSLITQCPGFHVVLVLSEEEFPKRERELPENLMLFVDNDLIELLWVKKNYKAFKKVLFTLDKYREVPVISADDDCIYTCNYAQEFYDKWQKMKNKNVVIRWDYKASGFSTSGPCCLYFGLGDKALFIISKLTSQEIKCSEDDTIVARYLKLFKYQCTFLYKNKKRPYKFHSEAGALHDHKRDDWCKDAYNWSA